MTEQKNKKQNKNRAKKAATLNIWTLAIGLRTAHTEKNRTIISCTAILVSANPLTSTRNVTHADQNLGGVFGLHGTDSRKKGNTTCHRAWCIGAVADITLLPGPLVSYFTVPHNCSYLANRSWACLVMANLNPTLTNTLTHISLCMEQH